MRAIKTITVVTIALFLLVGAVHGQPEQNGQPPCRKDFKEAMIKELGITPEQDKKLEENRKAQEAVMKKIHEAMKAQKDKLKEALLGPDVTRESVEGIVAEMKSLQSQMIDQRINAIFVAKSILTSEQFKKFNENIGRHLERKKGRFHGKTDDIREGPPMPSDEDAFEEPPQGPLSANETLQEMPKKANEQ